MSRAVTSEEEILKVSCGIVAKKGIAAVNMRTVASECGIALGSLYNYFSSKSELLSATIEAVWKDIFQMGNADQFIEIADADLVLGQDDDMVRLVDLIIEEVAFHAIDDLDVVGLVRRDFLEQREGLDDAVVGDGNGRMAPLLDGLDELFDRDQGVHVAHDRMQVEFDARRGIMVFPFHCTAVGFHHVVGHEDVVVLVIVVLDIAVDPDVDAGLELLDQVVVFFRRQIHIIILGRVVVTAAYNHFIVQMRTG